MVAGLLDTSVAIDLLRDYDPARDWLQEQAELGVTPIVWLEIIQGADDKAAMQSAIRLLKAFEQVQMLPSDHAWAIEQATRYTLSHNVGAFDCLIAAASFRLQVPLYTGNIKHFSPLLGKLAQRPY
jgi:predicted nucleic acid-binding protein